MIAVIKPKPDAVDGCNHATYVIGHESLAQLKPSWNERRQTTQSDAMPALLLLDSLQ